MELEEVKAKALKIGANVYRFHFDEYVLEPDAVGCFRLEDKWFIYSVDERINVSICGPFSNEGVVCALATSAWFGVDDDDDDDDDFPEDELDVFLNNHYHSMDEVKELYGKKE